MFRCNQKAEVAGFCERESRRGPPLFAAFSVTEPDTLALILLITLLAPFSVPREDIAPVNFGCRQGRGLGVPNLLRVGRWPPTPRGKLSCLTNLDGWSERSIPRHSGSYSGLERNAKRIGWPRKETGSDFIEKSVGDCSAAVSRSTRRVLQLSSQSARMAITDISFADCNRLC
jgi:hypothetical protein